MVALQWVNKKHLKRATISLGRLQGDKQKIIKENISPKDEQIRQQSQKKMICSDI